MKPTPLGEAYRKTVSGVHDMVIGLQVYVLEKAIDEIKSDYNKALIDAFYDPYRTNTAAAYPDPPDGEIAQIEEKIDELRSRIKAKAKS
jgi:hypothetical protein